MLHVAIFGLLQVYKSCGEVAAYLSGFARLILL